MVGNFDEDRFHETVMAYTSGRASIRDLEEYAEILKALRIKRRRQPCSLVFWITPLFPTTAHWKFGSAPLRQCQSFGNGSPNRKPLTANP